MICNACKACEKQSGIFEEGIKGHQHNIRMKLMKSKRIYSVFLLKSTVALSG
jgi:hypothetical protein